MPLKIYTGKQYQAGLTCIIAKDIVELNLHLWKSKLIWLRQMQNGFGLNTSEKNMLFFN